MVKRICTIIFLEFLGNYNLVLKSKTFYYVYIML